MRLSPPAWLTWQLTAGALVLIGAAWIFGMIAEDVVTAEPLTVFDAQVALWFHQHAVEPLTMLMIGVSLVNGIVGVSVMTFLWAAYLAYLRDWYWLLGVALAVPGGMVVNALVKLAFHRQRPVFDDPIVTLATYSFPSGHAAGATLFYGALGSYLMTRTTTVQRRFQIAIAAPLMVLLTGFSRIYLGAHYLTDVLGGIAEGSAWLALCMIGVSTLQRRRMSGKPA